jgi:UPF0716 protein FxsA
MYKPFLLALNYRPPSLSQTIYQKERPFGIVHYRSIDWRFYGEKQGQKRHKKGARNMFWQAGMGLILLELFTFIFVVGKIGFFKTFLLWGCSAVLGIWLVQAQGLAAASRRQLLFDKGESPASAVFESICLLIAGLLFIFPGFISDIAAFALLIPPLRTSFKSLLGKHFQWSEEKRREESGIIEADYIRVEEEIPRLKDQKTPDQ